MTDPRHKDYFENKFRKAKFKSVNVYIDASLSIFSIRINYEFSYVVFLYKSLWYFLLDVNYYWFYWWFVFV